MERKPAIEGRRVRIDQQLRGVESLSVARIVRTVRTQPVAGAGTHIGDEAVEHVAALFGQCDALDLRLSGPVEQAKLDGRGVRGEHGDVGAAGSEREAERLGLSGTDAYQEHPLGAARHPPEGDSSRLGRPGALTRHDGAPATRSRYSAA